jgi:hypothetical protein
MKKGMVFLMVLVAMGLFFALNGTAYAETLIMTVSPLQCSVGDTITVTYHGAPGDTSPVDDTIGLFPFDANNLYQAIAVQHLNGNMDGTLTFTAPNQVGIYNIRMLTSGTITIAVSQDIHVLYPGGSIMVNYAGAPGTSSDWIGLFATDAQGGQLINSQALNSAESGVLTFDAPKHTGNYNFRMFTGSVQTPLATSNDVQVTSILVGTPVQIVLQAYSPVMTINGANTVIDPASGAVPIIKNGRTLLPIRAIVENIGGTVNWDANAQEMSIQVENRIIQLGVGQTTAQVNGVSVLVDVAPQSFNGSILLPLRFVAENLGMDVQWDAASQTATLTYKMGTLTEPS